MAEIGDALVDIQADIKKFAADIEKVRAILETLDDKTIVIRVKLDKKSLTALQSQLKALDRIESLLSTQVSLLASVTRGIEESGAALANNLNLQDDYLRTEFELNRAIQSGNDQLRSQIQLRNELTREQLLQLQLARAERAEAARITRDLDARNSRMVTFTGILGQAVSRASQLGRIRFDNFNELFGNALAADSLLNALGSIFNSALKVRRIAVQMGAALATAFTVGAQAAGALITGLSTAIGLAGALAGVGLIAVTVKFLMDDAEVKAASDNAANIFKTTLLEASGDLKQNLIGFFDDFGAAIKSQAGAFEGFFNKVNGPLKRVGEEFNKFLGSEDFARILGKVGDATAGFLNKVADGLTDFILGTEKVFGGISKAAKDIRAAVGPGIFEGISADGIVAGIERLTRAIVSAGPGIRAFKENFGLAFDAVQVALEGVLKTVGEVGDELFNALGPIAAQAATTVGQVASSFIRLAAEVFPAVQAAAIEFTSVFGTAFAQSIEGLAEPLSAVINAALQLGTSLAPLLPIFSEILANLDPIAVGFLNLLNSLAPLAVAIGEFVAQLSAGIGPVFGAILTVFQAIGTVVSTILVPAFTLLNASGLVPLIGGITAVLAAMALFSATAAIMSVRAAATRASFTGLFGTMLALRTGFTAAGLAAQGTSTRMLAIAAAANTVTAAVSTALAPISAAFARITAAASTAAASIRVAFATVGTSISTGIGAGVAGAAARFPLLAAAARSTGAAIVAGTAAARASLISLGAAAASSAVGMRVAAVATTAMGAATKVAAAGARLAGTAFRFMGGPITLVIIGIELLIAGFKGFMRILGGVIEILKGVGKALVFDFDGAKESFSKGMDDIVGGAKDAAGQISDHFTGGGEEAAAGMTEPIKGALSSISLDSAAAGNAAGSSFLDQFKSQFEGLDFTAQVQGLEALFKNGGLLAGDGFVAGVEDRVLVANLAEAVKIDEGIVEAFRATGDAAGSGLSDALLAKIAELKGKAGSSLKELESLKEFGKQIGGPTGAAIVKSAEDAINAGKPGVQGAAKDALSVKEGEAAKQGDVAAKELITSVTQALQGAAPQITASISLAFDEAFGILPGVLGPKISAMLSTAFATSIATSGAALSPQIVASMSLAFDAAFAILPGVLGPKLSNMLSVAFATSISTGAAALSPQIVASMSLAFDGAFAILPGVLGPKLSNMLSVAFATSIASGATLSPQIVATMSLAFDGAFAILPGVLGPKLSLMLGALFAALDPAGAGLALSGTLTRIMQGAFGLAFISLPAVIAPLFSTALTSGTNQGLQGFGASLQGPINAAFVDGFSGVGTAISAPVTAAFSTTLGLADGFAGEMGAKMSTAATNMEQALDPLQTSIPRIFTEALDKAESETKSGMTAVKGAVESGVQAIEGLAPRFFNAGALLGQNLADGLRSKVGEVRAAAQELASAAGDQFPNSPAKDGPLSGKGDTYFRGQEFVNRLVKGLMDREPELRSFISQLAGGMANLNSPARVGGGGLSTSFGNTGSSGDLVGGFNPNIRGSILQQDRNASVSSGGAGQVLQIRPGNINVLLQGVDDPREFINALSRELMTNCTAR